MAYGRDGFRGVGTTTGGPDEDNAAGDRPARSAEERDRRARYLAKAASLGQVISEDESIDREV
jgi:hypothetical protein